MTTTGPDYIDLWPTRMLRFSLPGSAAANPLLAELIRQADSQRSEMTTSYLESDFLRTDHPVIEWLGNCLRRAVQDYATSLGIDYTLDYSLQGWANLNRFGDYHNLHNHPHSWLSGTYYVQMPDGTDDLPGRDDRNPGAISFFDPRGQANMNAIKGDGQVDPEYRVTPAAGDLLLWPAFLHHLVHPNLSQEQRMSVSFNVVLKWRDSYLP
ncbi:hypothetical protein GH722_11940 [Alphaproteobacteria bacterium HT1-32]|nr:hypothetical protein [Alphaproteobacteria bacterium HT1-32]